MLGVLTLAGCSSNAVVINQTPAQVTRAAGEEPGESAKFSGRTKWFYHCTPEFEFMPLAEGQNHDGMFQYELKITQVKMKISLEVESMTSGEALPIVHEHENGHVSICSQIYSEAKLVAIKAASSVIGTTYNGVGADSKKAKQAALDQAAEKICGLYRRETNDKANLISQLYDDICSHDDAAEPNVNAQVRQAFEKFEKLEKTPYTPNSTKVEQPRI